MTTGMLRCLLCDATQCQFRRLRPEKVYVCMDCLATKGPASQILDHLPEAIRAFRARHGATVLRP